MTSYQQAKQSNADKIEILPALERISNASVNISGQDHLLAILPSICLQDKDVENLLAYLDPAGDFANSYSQITKPLRLATVTVQSLENLASREVSYGVLPKKLPTGKVEFAVVNMAKPTVPLLLLSPEQINALCADKAYREPTQWLHGFMSSKAIQADLGKVSVDIVPALGSGAERDALKANATLSLNREYGRCSDYCREFIDVRTTFEDPKVLAQRLSRAYPGETITESDAKTIESTIANIGQLVGSVFEFNPDLTVNETSRNSSVSKKLSRATDIMIEVFNPLPEDSKEEQYVIRGFDVNGIKQSKSIHVEIANKHAFVYVPDAQHDKVLRVDLGVVGDDFKMSQFFSRLSLNVKSGSIGESELRRYVQRTIPAIASASNAELNPDKVNAQINKFSTTAPIFAFSEKRDSKLYSDLASHVMEAISSAKVQSNADFDISTCMRKFFSFFDFVQVGISKYIGVNPKFDIQTDRPPAANTFKPGAIPLKRVGSIGMGI